MTKIFRPLTLLCALLALAVSTDHALGQPQILGGAKERQPSYGEMENLPIFLTAISTAGTRPLSFA